MMSINKILNTKNKKMDKIDFIILSVIIAFYSVLSFINLGTTSSPWTFLTLNKEEEITLKLKDKEKVENMVIYPVLIKLHHLLIILTIIILQHIKVMVLLVGTMKS